MAKNNNIVSDSDTRENTEIRKSTTPTPAPTPTPTARNETTHSEKSSNYAYIGPSLPGSRLMSNAVISGTRKEISEYYKDVFDLYPNVEKLIVPVEKLSECRTKINTSGNILNKYYNDLLSQVQKGAAK